MKLKNHEVIRNTLSTFLARRRKYTEKASNNKVLEPARHMIGISSHQIKNKHEEKSSNKKLCEANKCFKKSILFLTEKRKCK